MANERNPGGDPTGLLQSLNATDETSLLRAENIGALVRKYISQTLDAVYRVSTGQISHGLSVASAQVNCGYYARILTGKVQDKYSIDGNWYPVGLAKHLRKELGVEGDDEKVISEAFAAITHHVFRILEEEDGDEAAIDELVRASIMLFSGIK